MAALSECAILIGLELPLDVKQDPLMLSRKISRPTNLQEGIALIEALMAIVLFSLGVLALVGVQASMTKNVTQAKLRGEASFLANQLIGQLWVDQVNLASYGITAGACDVGGFAGCTNWLASVQQLLPGGSAAVTVAAGGIVNITLTWQLPGQGELPAQFELAAYVTNNPP
jgi:type IV pilus assembly protein PilV